ncbi:hypothetical protein LPPLD21_00677 [Lactiplantibacillus paraplantarum]|uniref:Integral membrane protein n=1 Tax=Lactiplantibacillus paraplantarum TaxID=60520 RepID=A0ABQ0N7U7_9LACO|nr:ECF transporter S component [Lactiplantibacillus paraplantarum]KRL51144.1 hypothetical protein FD48_GL001422 [Lactiplantibacillus paraplantarum DSM 10667]MDL2060858.1 ECF transporter S component [Lactiplantibacillus paraplantarum]GBF01173.1 hypothetical protein LPPLD21_00677 [Lactiplantibacillus paraplantarum]GEO59783.1 hypothetical protein LPA07_01040 [Lactiplantibacillus paraplantarum]
MTSSLTVKRIPLLGALIAMQIILGSLLSIQLLLTKISFAFIIIALTARLFSPWVTAGSAALANLLGMLLFPKFTFFPWFSLNRIFDRANLWTGLSPANFLSTRSGR